MSIHCTIADGIAEVVMDRPPVNALHVQGWLDLAETFHRISADPSAHVAVLRAEGRGAPHSAAGQTVPWRETDGCAMSNSARITL